MTFRSSLLDYSYRGALLMAMAFSHGLMAADTDVNFSGFASLGYAKTLGSSDEGPLNEITGEGEYRDFNKLGLRMDADMHDKVSFASQLVAYGKENYNPEFDWIYVNVELTSELRLDIGKTRFPLYMYSDYIDVGYAYQWVEPPYVTYGRSFFQTLDGLKLSYVTNIGEWESELLVFGGKTEEHFKSDDGIDDVDLLIEDVAGAAWTGEYEWLTLRAVYAQGYITIDGYSGLEGLVGAVHDLGTTINMAVPPGFGINTGDVESMIALQRDKLEYAGIGAGLDFDVVFAILEITESRFDPNLGTNDYSGGYFTVGTRLPYNLTLSATYSEKRQKPNEDIMEEYLARVSPYIGMDPGLDAYIGVVGTNLDTAIKAAQDKTLQEYSLQLRWDFHKSAAFKFEYLIQDVEQVQSVETIPAVLYTPVSSAVEPQAYRIGLDIVF